MSICVGALRRRAPISNLTKHPARCYFVLVPNVPDRFGANRKDGDEALKHGRVS
jgi:hypothetical protein